jgi:hypothetical protein
VLDLGKQSVIYKMHGSIAPDPKWDNFVITEGDYVDFLSRMAAKDRHPFGVLPVLPRQELPFLGYSLRDWNLRVILRKLTNARPVTEQAKSWAIQRDPSELEVKLWEKRNVNIYNEDINSFVSNLRKWM